MSDRVQLEMEEKMIEDLKLATTHIERLKDLEEKWQAGLKKLPPGVAHRLAEMADSRITETMKRMRAAAIIMEALDKMINFQETETIIEYKGRMWHVQTIDDFRPYLKVGEL